MSQIKISCIGSTAVFTNTPNIFSGGNVDTVKFEFDGDWDNFTTKTAVFYTNPKETSLQVLDSNNVATIPANMISQKGKLSIGVIGTNSNDDIKTSKILTYIVGKGAVTDDMETTAPTPDIWLQMLSIVSHNKDIVDNMELIVDESQLQNKANKDLSNVLISDLQSKGVLRVESGSYTGTGTYGLANPNTLTFDFTPKILIVDDYVIPCTCTSYQKHYTSQFINVTWGNNSVSWYCTDSQYAQYNESGKTYNYMVIG